MKDTPLDQLLSKMPAIAEAVNAFKSESVQQRAFQVLMRSLVSGAEGLEDSVPPFGEGENDKEDNEGGSPKTLKRAGKFTTPSQRKKAKVASGPPKVLGDLNLRPDGKKSLIDFVNEKKPRTNEERFAVIIYYQQNTLKLSQISRDHIHTGFKALGIKSPLDIDAALRMAASRKGWIDTSDATSLKMKVAGENLVEHDLPGKDADGK